MGSSWRGRGTSGVRHQGCRGCLPLFPLPLSGSAGSTQRQGCLQSLLLFGANFGWGRGWARKKEGRRLVPLSLVPGTEVLPSPVPNDSRLLYPEPSENPPQMAGLTLLSSVKWGQTVSESQASAYQRTGPLPHDRQTAHGQGCTRWAGCIVGAQGIQGQQLTASGGGRHIWLKDELVRLASSDQATTLLTSLPASQGQVTVNLPSLNGEELQRAKGQSDPTEHYVWALWGSA